MSIRNARPEDFPSIHRLAAALDLDYRGMEADRVWVAEEDGRIVGIVALKTHPDCRELVSLGVDLAGRSAGLGGRLIETVMTAGPGDVYLATVIPRYFVRHGFRKTLSMPPGMAKDPAWCEGCSKERCVIMARKQK
jgi:N-acetylglutamate synthase-like GNAT family acetyltransferase